MWSVAEGVSCAGGGVVWVSGSLSAALLAWACGRAPHSPHPTPHTRAQYTNENELKTQKSNYTHSQFCNL
jgi:hypothetical protein